MNTSKTLLAAALAATLAAGAFAQAQPMPPQPGQPPMMMRGDHGPDRARMMQERMARRQAELKAKLQITPAQEGAWNAWTQAMRPAANRPQRPNFVEFARMTTPQRIDRMRELRNQRNAEQDRRGEATKAFYSQLSPAQQKVFDEQSFERFGRGGERGGHHGRGMHRG
ncbi:Spy/CpxP family protein refolding chaperone [Ramlibacter albus]|uniref:Spy/CpxP family protein refolding chaperone n=1 Tax=Ramlibacter albus TaxID=2079448 RepID=A0A923S0W1_9BURK|nr:Spy/CpxP family protein refolding chaperone [Ramlibacter albus]MBC5763789.1 Spy/CpxP family protein refolding chaperone [Ramlibacter albus]